MTTSQRIEKLEGQLEEIGYDLAGELTDSERGKLKAKANRIMEKLQDLDYS